jgi:hypothetical protein
VDHFGLGANPTADIALAASLEAWWTHRVEST